MTFPDIAGLVPHADSMILLDRMIAVDEESLTAEVVITPSSMFFDGQTVGAWVGIEYMAQAIAAFAGYQALQEGGAVKVGFLLGSRRYQAHCASFALGSVLHIYVRRILQSENGLGAFECTINLADQVDGAELATATVTVFQPENATEFLHNTTE